MFAVVQNGEVRQILQMDVPFSVGDKHYSSNFLRTSSAQEKIEAGVWEIIEGQRPDDRFYWVSGPAYRVVEANSTVEASYSRTAKQLEDVTENEITTKGLKSQFVSQVKNTAHSLLTPTDWAVLRQLLKGIGMSAHIENFRNAVIDASNQFETQINACTTVEELAALQFNWPNQSDF